MLKSNSLALKNAEIHTKLHLVMRWRSITFALLNALMKLRLVLSFQETETAAIVMMTAMTWVVHLGLPWAGA